MGTGGNWSDLPLGGWRPPTWRDQFALIVWTVIGLTLLVDVLLAVWVVQGFMAGESQPLGTWVLCSAGPLNVLGFAALVWWLVRRARQRRNR